MQERPFPSFIQDESKEIFTLSEKEMKSYEKAKSDLIHAFTTLNDRLIANELETGFKTTLCSLLETYMVDLTKSLKYTGELEAEKEQRVGQIRSLNIENRELRKQLGEKVSLEDIREKVKNLKQVFSKWWDDNGCGYDKDHRLEEYGYKCTLSGHIFGRDILSEGESSEEIAKKLQNEGFQIYGEQGSHQLAMSDTNIIILEDLLKSRFPSCEITSFKGHHAINKGFVINELEIVIRDLNDFEENENNDKVQS